MKPVVKNVNAPCKSCNQAFDHEVYYRVDGEGYPALKARVLNATIFASTCPHCGKLSGVPQELKYSDTAKGRYYIVHYFPEWSIDQMQNQIAETMSLRRSGARVHFEHKVQHLIETIQFYDAGFLPEERLLTPSPEALARIQPLEKLADETSSRLIGAVKTGELPPDFIENVKRGREIIQAQATPPKKSFWARLFGK